MSASVKPFSAGAQGRFPLPPWARAIIVGVVFLTIVVLMVWVFVIAPPKRTDATPTGDWQAGRPLPMPKAEATSLPVQTSVPGPVAPATTAVAATVPTLQPMLVWGAGESTEAVGSGGHSPIGGSHSPAQPYSNGGSTDTELSSRLHATETTDSEADVYTDLGLLLPEGTVFSCLPKEAVDTQLIGKVTCVVDEIGGVMAADGNTILIDRGASVTGEIQRGIEGAQNRVFILWNKIRSSRVRVDHLGSAGVDLMGQMGAPGEVDEHLWAKVKAAALLTGIETAGNAAQNYTQKSGSSSVNFSNGQSLASQALAHDINIQPTLWRGRGTPLKIQVGHDIWFKRAYNNVLVAGVK